jgi:hypothetical protein
MVDFMRTPKKRPFKERLQMVARLLNEKGKVSVKDLVLNWGVTPHYAVTILKWALEKYPYAQWDGDDKILFIPEREKEAENEH